MKPVIDFEAMRNVDIRTVDPATLVDSRNVVVNTGLPFYERALDYIEQIGNPYCYRYGDIIVKISHSQTSTASLTDCIEELLRSFL